jgi:hypothetical protein
MHSTNPPLRKRAVLIALACMAAMIAFLVWIGYLTFNNLVTG